MIISTLRAFNRCKVAILRQWVLFEQFSARALYSSAYRTGEHPVTK